LGLQPKPGARQEDYGDNRIQLPAPLGDIPKRAMLERRDGWLLHRSACGPIQTGNSQENHAIEFVRGLAYSCPAEWHSPAALLGEAVAAGQEARETK